MLAKDLCARKAVLKQAMDKGTFILLICGGFSCLASRISMLMVTGLKAWASMIMKPQCKQNARCIGNIAIDANLDGKKDASSRL